MGRGAGLAVPDRVGERIFEALEDAVLVRIVEPRRRQLGDLVPQQVDLPGPLPLGATERSQLSVDLGEPRPRRAQGRQVDAAEAVQRGALGRAGEQALVIVLAVEVDETR